MATRKIRQAKGKTKSWKDISQNVKAKAMSSTAWKRVQLQRLKFVFGMACVAFIGFAGYKVIASAEFEADLLSKAGDSLPINEVIIDSDGTLPESWVLDFLGLNRELDLLEVDIDGMKGKLLAVSQIKQAEIERQFPDKLIVSIEERLPVAKILAQNQKGDEQLLLVDGDGIAYKGFYYERKFVKALPYLAGVRLKRDGDGFLPIEKMGDVETLLATAKNLAPHLYSTWKIVSLEQMPNIVVKSRFAREVVFEPGDYQGQLARLDYILDYYKGHMLSNVARVDLTLGVQVPVRPK